jgi:muconolactone delta-isomerase
MEQQARAVVHGKWEASSIVNRASASADVTGFPRPEWLRLTTRKDTPGYFVRASACRGPSSIFAAKSSSACSRKPRAEPGAVDAGLVTNLWKVVGQGSVFANLDVPDHSSGDQALESLPVIQKPGSSRRGHAARYRRSSDEPARIWRLAGCSVTPPRTTSRRTTSPKNC